MASSSDTAKKQSGPRKSAPEDPSETLVIVERYGSVYSLSNNKKWAKGINANLGYGRYFSPAVAYLPKTHCIIIAGGWDHTRETLCHTQMFDFTELVWKDQPPMKTKRDFTAGVCLADGITFLVCGGRCEPQTLSSCEQFDSKTKTWTSVASLSTPRRDHTMVSYKGTPVVLGGKHEILLNTAERYEMGEWSPFPPFNVARRDFGAAVVYDKIYIAGGRIDGGHSGTLEAYSSTIEAYDGASWSILPTELPSGARYEHTAVCFHNKLAVFGGNNRNIEVYDPIEKTCTATRLPILVFGTYYVFVVLDWGEEENL